MLSIKEAHKQDLLSKKHVVGVAVGEKRRKGDPTGEQAVMVLVERKVPASQLSNGDLVPSRIDGAPTDVVEVGFIQAPPPFRAQGVWTGRYRPPVPGVSIGHKNVTAGTLGCLVEYKSEPLILSNNHVLACSNAGEVGDPILQPGAYDGGALCDRVAELVDFVPIKFAGGGNECKVATALAQLFNAMASACGRSHRFDVRDTLEQPNLVDAALAKPTAPVSSEIIDGVGTPRGIATAGLGTNVQKCGRTTGHTYGHVEQIEATVRVSYGAGRVATFEHQLVLGPMSAGGDSGSAVLDMDRNVVGLLFAGSDRVTIISPISYVLDALNVKVVT